MSSTVYGLSALMETINHMGTEQENNDAIIDNAAMPAIESVNYLDAVEAGLMAEDEMSSEDFEDDVDPDDPEINKMLAQIAPDDDEEALDKLDDALESYIAECGDCHGGHGHGEGHHEEHDDDDDDDEEDDD